VRDATATAAAKLSVRTVYRIADLLVIGGVDASADGRINDAYECRIALLVDVLGLRDKSINTLLSAGQSLGQCLIVLLLGLVRQLLPGREHGIRTYLLLKLRNLWREMRLQRGLFARRRLVVDLALDVRKFLDGRLLRADAGDHAPDVGQPILEAIPCADHDAGVFD